MSQLRVWAPNAREVALATGPALADRRPMRREEGGWWSIEAPDVGPNVDYGFALDGGEPRPDPRALRLPEGVHGPSRLVDHAASRWTDDEWQAPALADAIVYELHVGTFSPEGTFDGVAGRLDYLVDLGITHIELMPVGSFPGRFDWGYDGVGLFAPQETYGGPDGLKRLVNAAHEQGIGVILDVVYNHFGPEGNYLDAFGPYRTERFHTPWGAAVNLGERGAHEVRRFLIENALMWLRDYHVDGLRIDAVHAFMDLTATHFLEELAAEVDELGRRLGRRLALIAESDLNDPRLLRDRERGGYGLDAQWSDDFHHALHVTLTGERSGYYADFEPLADLARALERTWVYQGQFSPARGRLHGRTPAGLDATRFLGYAQTHDQVGNRAHGERLSQLVDEKRLRIAATLVLTGPFVPMIFAGEEWAASTPFLFFADFGDAALRQAVREGRRREFEAFGGEPASIPDPTDPSTFERSRLDWSEVEREPHRGIRDWYRRLIDLRRQTPAMRDGRNPSVELDPAQGLVVSRKPGVEVAVNFGPHPVSTPAAAAVRLVASGPGVESVAGRLELPPLTAAVIATERR